MTKNDIMLICDKLGIVKNEITPLTQLRYICLSKLETKVINPESRRFEFDMDNEVLVEYFCKEVGYVPSAGKGDVFQDRNYAYLTDENGELLRNVYEFENIMSIGIL